MKLFIINGENNDEKIEIHINKDSIVKDIEYKLDEIRRGNGNSTKYYFSLIHKNIILLNDNAIKYYKICENDEIWFGKIDNYLRNRDDVIVDVFHWGIFHGEEYLIMKMNDRISTIRLIIERIHSGIIDIWNADGKKMKNDQIVTEIATNENYKLIIRCDDGEGIEINYTFDQGCYMLDKLKVDRYLYVDQIRDENKNRSKLMLIILLGEFEDIISSNDTIDDRLNQNLSDLPSSFLNSTNLFCSDMKNYILDICIDYWRLGMNECVIDDVMIIGQYFPVAIRAALWDYSIVRQQHDNNKTNKSVRDIIIDSLDNFCVNYLLHSSKDWRYWLRLRMKQHLWRSLSDSDLDVWIDEFEINKFRIKVRMNGKDRDHLIGFKPETIIKAKQSISLTHKVDMKHLYCINPGGDHKPNDEDKFEDEFIIEIVMR